MIGSLQRHAGRMTRQMIRSNESIDISRKPQKKMEKSEHQMFTAKYHASDESQNDRHQALMRTGQLKYGQSALHGGEEEKKEFEQIEGSRLPRPKPSQPSDQRSASVPISVTGMHELSDCS